MTLTLDATQQRFGPNMNLEQYHNQPPAFSNPWTSSSSSSSSQPPAPSSSMYVPGSQQPSSLTAGLMAAKNPVGRPPASSSGPSIPPYGSLPVTSSAGMWPTSLLADAQMLSDNYANNLLRHSEPEPPASNFRTLWRSLILNFGLSCQWRIRDVWPVLRQHGLCPSANPALPIRLRR